MNYTGDVLHFGMAVEKARAEGIKVEQMVVGDDVGVGRKRGGRIGRRGLAGTVLVQKIAAAAAAQGYAVSPVMASKFTLTDLCCAERVSRMSAESPAR